MRARTVALLLAVLASAGAQSISQTTTYNFCGGSNGATIAVESTASSVFYNLTTNTAPLYPNSAACTVTLRPAAGLGMSFRFDSFATEPDYDFFKAAAASGAPLVPSSSGFTAPQLGLALSSPASQSVTLSFSSDTTSVYGGVAVRVSTTFNAIGGAPRACNEGVSAQSCSDLRTQGCNWCQDGAGRCDFTGRLRTAFSSTVRCPLRMGAAKKMSTARLFFSTLTSPPPPSYPPPAFSLRTLTGASWVSAWKLLYPSLPFLFDGQPLTHKHAHAHAKRHAVAGRLPLHVAQRHAQRLALAHAHAHAHASVHAHAHAPASRSHQRRRRQLLRSHLL